MPNTKDSFEFDSSTTPLGSSATWTSKKIQTTGFSRITALWTADQASITNGVIVEQSGDGVSWIKSSQFTQAANQNDGLSVPILANYARIAWTNGGVAQGTFEIYVYIKR